MTSDIAILLTIVTLLNASALVVQGIKIKNLEKTLDMAGLTQLRKLVRKRKL